MTTFGYAFLLVGALLIRQVAVGRTKDIPGDMSALTTAFLNADVDGMRTVLAARGTNVSAEVDGTGSLDTSADTPLPFGGNNDFANKVIDLGQRARGYRLGATGPDYYDCSGLIWRAARDLKYYDGGRFTTSSFHSIARRWCVQVNEPAIGDIVLWPTHHMGVSVGNGNMFSARSTSKGIGMSSIAGDNKYFGSAAEYWRPVRG